MMKCALLLLATPVLAGVGDPQLQTDHPFYEGELSCSDFPRLFKTQAVQFKRVTGVEPKSDQERALASWFWRNTHFAHGEEGTEDLWGTGFKKGDLRTREYWTGLFAHGFGLCGTTHSQWTAEFEALLGHGRGRGVGVQGHNSFEAYLTGGPYGAGRWALIDHDISTVVFDPKGESLLSIPDVKADLKQLTDRKFSPQKQNGWLVCGLDAGDGGVYRDYNTAELLPGYSGPPPIVHLRKGETLRRYFQPGLDDGKTFVFWGRNYKSGGIPGPERAQTWVNQPERMFRSTGGTGYHAGQARYANAVYEYTPDFKSDAFHEGVIAADDQHVVLEFYTPYIIAATPPNDAPWGIYDDGCRNGLVVHGTAGCDVSVSVDQGRIWSKPVAFADGLDLTDHVKGRRQYWLKLEKFSKPLPQSTLTLRTVCQANAAIFPRLHDGKNTITSAASGRAIVSAGPNKPQADAHIVEGSFGKPRVTLELITPRGEKAVTLYAAVQMASSNPPSPDVNYQIEYSSDGGKSWHSVVEDWKIPRQGNEPADFWSQSFCYGSVDLTGKDVQSVRVRFRNDGGKSVLRAEAHLVYRVEKQDDLAIVYDWTDDTGPHRQSFTAAAGRPGSFQLTAGKNVNTRWVEMAPK